MLFSWSHAVCCWVEGCGLLALSAFVLVSFLGLVYGGSDVPSDGPLLRVILLLEDILIPLPINSNTHRFCLITCFQFPLYRLLNICRATTRLPSPSSTAECLRLIAHLREEQASAASWEPRPPFEAAEMD